MIVNPFIFTSISSMFCSALTPLGEITEAQGNYYAKCVRVMLLNHILHVFHNPE